MKSVSDYIGDILLFALICLPFVIIIRYFVYLKTKKLDFKREALILLLSMTVFSILCMTVIPPQVFKGDFTSQMFHKADFSYNMKYPELQIGWIKWKITTKEYDDILINIVGNIAVFIPIGFLICAIRNKADAVAVFAGLMLSCIIEFCQLFIDRNSDYNDIILNTSGALIGALIYLLIRKIKKKTRAE